MVLNVSLVSYWSDTDNEDQEMPLLNDGPNGGDQVN